MEPISFHPDETTIKAPPGAAYLDLPALGVRWGLEGIGGFISCWLPYQHEAQAIARGNPIYLMVLGERQPPVSLTADRHSLLGPEDPGFPPGTKMQIPKQKQLEMTIRVVRGDSGSEVRMEFNQALAWISVSPERAVAIAKALVDRANDARGSGLVYPPGYVPPKGGNGK